MLAGKVFLNLWLDAPHGKSPTCYVWWQLVQIISKLYEWELLIVCHHHAKFVAIGFAVVEMLLVFHVTQQDDANKGSSDYIYSSPSR